jgi:hypothetical protein
MKYRVVWLSDVLDETARCYVRAEEAGRDAPAIHRAMNQITERLGREGAAAGESRVGANRILIEHPLVVTFEVSEDQQVVVIKAVRYLDSD